MPTIISKAKPIDRWIPWFFVLFFAVFSSVDATFVTLALRTNTGVVTTDPYEKGLAYNDTLRAAAIQHDLGWTSQITFSNGIARLILRDKDGHGIDNAQVVAKFTRPVMSGHDFDKEMTMTTSGTYETPATFPLQGQWKIRIFAKWQNKTYQASQLIIAP